jgi:hypothetical protein
MTQYPCRDRVQKWVNPRKSNVPFSLPDSPPGFDADGVFGVALAVARAGGLVLGLPNSISLVFSGWQLLQPAMVNVVEESTYICIQNPVDIHRPTPLTKIGISGYWIACSAIL